jgi:hypothetical protein
MGNQGYSNEGTRQCAEMIWNGDIGNVTEVHAWTNRPIWPQGVQSIPAEAPVPDTLDWDTWLGVAAMRPYSPEYLPFNWRGWFDFGCGALGDMACHILGAPNMALMLGAPTSVECISQEAKSPYSFPKSSVIRFDFPARENMPAVKIFWYDGMAGPPKRPEGLAESEWLGDLPRRASGNAGAPRPSAAATETAANTPAREVPEWLRRKPTNSGKGASNGSLFVGDKGYITTGTYGEGTRILPAERMNDYKFPPEFLTRSPGHYRDWIRAAKGGEKACSNFSIAAPFTEWILLGAISLRVEGKLEWDSEKMKITNNSEANQYIRPNFRKGWKLS